MSEAPATRPRTWFAPVPVRRLELVRRCTFGYALAWLVVRFAYLADVAGLPARRFEPAPPEIGVAKRTGRLALDVGQ